MMDWPRRGIALLLLLCALAVAWLAAERVIAFAAMASGDRVITALGDGKKVLTRFIEIAARSREKSINVLNLPEARTQLGGLFFLLAERESAKSQKRDSLYARAEEALFEGISMAPAQPFAWLQLTDLWYQRRGGGGQFNALLEMSFRVAPNERRVIVPRLKLGYRARNDLSKDNAARIAGDVQSMARYQTFNLAEFARTDFALPWISENLKSDPGLHRKFISDYLRLPPR